MKNTTKTTDTIELTNDNSSNLLNTNTNTIEPIMINFLEIASDLPYVATKLVEKINVDGIPRHLPITTLKKLEILSDKIDLSQDFACVGVIPSINVKDEPLIVKPTLFNHNGEIWLFDSKLTPYKKVEKINDWLIGIGAFAEIIIDDITLIVNISGDKTILEKESKISISNKTHGDLTPEMLTPPITVNTPLKARMFKVDGVYEVVKNHNIRAMYHEKENDIDVETGLLVDVKIDDKTTIKNVICNSQLERLIENNKLPFKFKIADKKTLKDKKTKVIIIDPNRKQKEMKLEDLDLL